MHTTSVEKPIHGKITQLLKKQRYQIVGEHSGVKACHWFRKSLLGKGVCYKEKFFGTESHRCLQMTPSVIWCTQRCVFCWRVQPEDIGFSWKESSMADFKRDDPEYIIENAVKAQRRILTGYNPKHHKNVNPKKYEEALNPRHAAISLSGEPTLFPELGDLIDCFHEKGFTTFLVTNGTLPERLSSITEPTQLYFSLVAPDEKTYNIICRPHLKDGWERVNQTLELFPSFSCPTVLRMTLVKPLNTEYPEKYAKLIEKAEPTYVEPKSYMSVGYSIKRQLSLENMLFHQEVKDFATKISELTGYSIIDESSPSRVVLLSKKHKRPVKLA